MRFCEKGTYHWWKSLRRANRGGWRGEGNPGDDRLRGQVCGRGRRRWPARVAAGPRRRSRARRVASPAWPSSPGSCGLGHRSASAPRRTPPCRPPPPATPPPCWTSASSPPPATGFGPPPWPSTENPPSSSCLTKTETERNRERENEGLVLLG